MSRSAGVRGSEAKKGVLGSAQHVHEGRNYRFAYQGFPLAKAYAEGRLEIRVLVEGGSKFLDALQIGLEPSRRADEPVTGHALEGMFPDNRRELVDAKRNRVSHIQDEMVLIALVQDFDGMEVLVPARIGLERVQLVDDVFGGDMHLSGTNGALKTLRRLCEGETDPFWSWCIVAHHRETKMIQRGPEIVDGIADDQGKMGLWDGWIGVDVNHAPRGVLVLADSDAERIVREVFGNPPVQIVDVLLGPL